MSAGDPPPSDPEAFAPTIAPVTSQRPPVPSAGPGPTTRRATGVESYQDTIAGGGDPRAFVAALDALAATAGPEAAAARFLQTVLGEAAWARMPQQFRARACAAWPQIRGDCAALDAYRVRYAELAAVDVPVRLLGGDRSAAYFRPTLEALARALPRATLAIVAGAGHMLHAEAPRAFAEHVDALAAATA